VKKIFSCIDWINDRVGRLCFPLILLLSFIVLYEIMMRSLFHPTLWTYETTQYIFIICSLLPAGLLQKENQHIDVDIITSHLSQKTRVILKIAVFPFFLLYIGAMAYFGFDIFFESARTLETSGSAWDPYTFPVKFMVPFGAFLLLLQGIANLARDIEKTFFLKTAVNASAKSKEDLGSY